MSGRGLSAAVVVAALAGGAATASLVWKPARDVPAPQPSVCERVVVPAYFEPPDWPRASGAKPPPASMILDISGMGAGPAARRDFRAAVGTARAAGVTVLGYISTVDGRRPLAEAETEVRNYAAWYGVTSVFLDRVSGRPAQLGYYRALADYVRSRDPGAQLWLNPGDYPDPAYMSLGAVVMTFEGSYAQYKGAGGAAVPDWARRYPPGRFAHTVYAASATDLRPALRLAVARNAGYVYVTDGTGGNPYAALPGYWAAEDAAAAASCARPGGGR